MGDFSQSVDVEKLISYSDDLVECLRGKRDIDSLTQCLEHSSALQSSCDADFGEVQSLVQGSLVLSIFTFDLFGYPENWRKISIYAEYFY